MKKKGKGYYRVTTGEVIFFSFCVIAICGLFVLGVIFKSYDNNLKMSIEELKYELSLQEKKNESLNMQVNELTSYDKIKDIVNDMGLSYNNENIIVINK